MKNLMLTNLIFFAMMNLSFAQLQQVYNQYPANGSTNIAADGTCAFSWTLSGSGQEPATYVISISLSTDFTQSVYSAFIINNEVKNLSVLLPSTKYYWRIAASGLDINTGNLLAAYSSPTYFTTSSALPVELTNFSANVNGNKVTLNWSTATEVNDYGFDIERATDNKSFTKIGFVAGSGNSNSVKNYSYTDNAFGYTNVSYRLKQINTDGTFKYYNAITVTLTGGNKAELMDNYPNPFNPSTAIKFYIPNSANVSVKIYDMLGKEVTTLVNSEEGAGYHIVYWNGRDKFGSEVASGIYLCRMQAGDFVQTKKLMLMK